MNPPPTATPSILDALDHPELFAPHFRGATWTAWRAFLAGLFGLGMDDAARAIYTRHTGRADPPAAPFSEAALIVGRRGGKSRVLALCAVFLACFRDYAPHLAPGEMATVAVIAANRQQARTIFRFVSGLLHAVPVLGAMIAEETNEAITLTNNVAIEISTASFRTTRGYSFAAVLCDEIAFWRQEESSANPDVEILRALRPGMASIPGSLMLLASSPYAKKGELYNAFRRHYGEEAARVLVWKADTAAMNPRIDPAIIAEAYEADPEAARAEYGAEFRDDLADFITREAIDAVTCWGRHELPPESGVSYSAFADPSGGASDSFCLAIGHQDGDMGVLDALLEIRAPFDPDKAVAECASVLERYGVSRVVGDHYAGRWPVARFAAHGISFEQSARPKSEIYADFLPLATARRVELLDIKRLAAQFVGLERRTGRSGKDSIAEPRGAHDDACNAVAGVLVGLDLDRRPALIRRDDVLVENAPAELARPCAFIGTLWVGVDGMAASALFAYGDLPDGRLVLMDFDAQPWNGSLIEKIAGRLDELCEAARERDTSGVPGGISAFLHLPAQLFEVGQTALRKVFAPRLDRHDGRYRTIAPVAIDPMHLADPVHLILGATANVAAGRVKLGAAALARSAGKPLLGSLAIKPGERADADPLRIALLIAIAELDPPPSRAEGARAQFA